MKEIKFKFYQILKRLGFVIPVHVVLEYAKYVFINKYKYNGMCYSIETACAYFWIYPVNVHHFPKFNPKFCEADDSNISYGIFWWDDRRLKPRIKAFDKLIAYYKEHKEYI